MRRLQPCLPKRSTTLASGTTLARACRRPQLLVRKAIPTPEQTRPLLDTAAVGPCKPDVHAGNRRGLVSPPVGEAEVHTNLACPSGALVGPCKAPLHWTWWELVPVRSTPSRPCQVSRFARWWSSCERSPLPDPHRRRTHKWWSCSGTSSSSQTVSFGPIHGETKAAQVVLVDDPAGPMPRGAHTA